MTGDDYELASLEKDITALLIDEPDFIEIQDKLEFYCPFDALNVARAEIRHAAFLADTINPHGTHGIGSKGLEEFVDAILTETANDELRLLAHFGQFGNATIRREWKDIDLLIELPLKENDSLVIVIELKIDAALESHQLEKYETIVRSHWPSDTTRIVKVVLAPSSLETNSDDWIGVGLEPILARFDKIAESSEGSIAFRLMLASYCALIRRNHLSDSGMEELASKIWARHGRVLEFLIERKPDVIRDLRSQIGSFPKSSDHTDARSKEFLQQVSRNETWSLEPDACDRRFFRFSVSNWKKFEFLQDPKRKLEWNNSYLIIEMIFNANNIWVKFLISGGHKGVDENLFRRLTENNEIESRNRRAVPKQWGGMSGQELLNLDNTEGLSIEEAYVKLTENLRSYLSEKIPVFSKELEAYDNEIKSRS